MARPIQAYTRRVPCQFLNSDLFTDICLCIYILNRWKNYYSQLVNVRSASDVRQIQIRTAEPLVSDASPFGVEIAIAKLKSYNSPGSDQISSELIQAGGETLRSEIHKLSNYI
jgi:hypothetical protein